MTRPLVTLPGVELCAVGTWDLSSGPYTFTRHHLAEAVKAAECPAVGPPIIRLGHSDPRFMRFDGEPGVGRVKNLRLDASGMKLLGDLTGMPGWLGDVAASAYPNRSVEGQAGFQCQIGHVHAFALTGLALLGVTPPGVGVLNSLDDIPALFDVEAKHGGSPMANSKNFSQPPHSGDFNSQSHPPFKGTHSHPVRHSHNGDSNHQGTRASYGVPGRPPEQIIAAAVQRGAVSESRAGYYRALAAAGEDISYVDDLAGTGGGEVYAAGGVGTTVNPPQMPHRADTDPTLFAVNPLFEELSASRPFLVSAAMAENPNPPKLFGDRDLPPFTASGLDPNILMQLPWPLRRPVAAAGTLKAAYVMVEKYAGAPELTRELSTARANSDYLNEFSAWLKGNGPDSNGNPPEGLGAAQVEGLNSELPSGPAPAPRGADMPTLSERPKRK